VPAKAIERRSTAIEVPAKAIERRSIAIEGPSMASALSANPSATLGNPPYCSTQGFTRALSIAITSSSLRSLPSSRT
jgi:hypothetical protein